MLRKSRELVFSDQSSEIIRAACFCGEVRLWIEFRSWPLSIEVLVRLKNLLSICLIRPVVQKVEANKKEDIANPKLLKYLFFQRNFAH